MEDLMRRSTELLEELFVAVECQRCQQHKDIDDDAGGVLRPELSPETIAEIEDLSAALRRAWLRMRAERREERGPESLANPQREATVDAPGPTSPTKPQCLPCPRGEGVVGGRPVPRAPAGASSGTEGRAEPTPLAALPPGCRQTIREERRCLLRDLVAGLSGADIAEVRLILEEFKDWLRPHKMHPGTKRRYITWVRSHVFERTPVREKEIRNGMWAGIEAFGVFMWQVRGFEPPGIHADAGDRTDTEPNDAGDDLLGTLKGLYRSRPAEMTGAFSGFRAWLVARGHSEQAAAEHAKRACRCVVGDPPTGPRPFLDLELDALRLFTSYLSETGWDLRRGIESSSTATPVSIPPDPDPAPGESPRPRTIQASPEEAETQRATDPPPSATVKRRRCLDEPQDAGVGPEGRDPEETRASERGASDSEASTDESPSPLKRRKRTISPRLVFRPLEDPASSPPTADASISGLREAATARCPVVQNESDAPSAGSTEAEDVEVTVVEFSDRDVDDETPAKKHAARPTATKIQFSLDDIVRAGAERLGEYYRRYPEARADDLVRFRAWCTDVGLSPASARNYAAVVRVVVDGDALSDRQVKKARCGLLKFFDYHLNVHDWDPCEGTGA